MIVVAESNDLLFSEKLFWCLLWLIRKFEFRRNGSLQRERNFDDKTFEQIFVSEET